MLVLLGMKTFLGRLSLLTSTGLPCSHHAHTRSRTTSPHLYRHISDLVWNLHLFLAQKKKQTLNLFSVILLANFTQSSSGLSAWLGQTNCPSHYAWVYSLGSYSHNSPLLLVFSDVSRHSHLKPTLKHFWAKQRCPKNNQIQLLQLPPSTYAF